MSDTAVETNKTPQDYLASFKRRKYLLLFTTLLVFAAVVGITFYLPPVYRSTATILIEEPEVPEALVQSTVTTYADQRIEIIKQRVMTTENLSGIMKRYDLYKQMRETTPLSEIIEKFRKDILVETIAAPVFNSRQGRASRATIAFTLSYDSTVPRLAQQVTNELVTLYLSENARERQGQAAATTKFLSQETERLSSRIRELESGLSKFKQKYAGRLPQQLTVNLDVINRSEQALSDIERRIDGLRERQAFLKSELAGQSPWISPQEQPRMLADPNATRLATLRSEYARVVNSYGPSHPQLRRLQDEIAALEKSMGMGAGTQGYLQAELERARVQLTRAQETNSQAEQQQAQTWVTQLEEDIANSRQNPGGQQLPNPTFVQTRSQLNSVNVELAALVQQRATLAKKLKDYEQRVAETPEIEREYLTLVRDYDNAQRTYAETKDKQQQAELAQSLETERKSERFALIEPPALPIDPVAPNKPLILAIGFLISIGLGLGLVQLVGMFDNRVHGARQVAALAGELPLVVVPYVVTPAEQMRTVMAKLTFVFVALIAVAVALYAVHAYVMPIDVLGHKVLAAGGSIGGQPL